MSLILLACASLLVSVAGVAAFIGWAARGGLIDVPNLRSSHQVPTPRGAGAVIVLVVTAVAGYGAYRAGFDQVVIAVPALLIAGISGADDIRSLPSWLRLLVHTGCAVVVVLAVRQAVPGGWPLAAMILSTVWIVGLTNAYNFMDGIDGISGAQAVVSGLALTVAAMHAGLLEVAAAGIAIAAASAGFLVHNWSPARVFMGDVGSAFLGFSFAAGALQVGSVSRAAGVMVGLSLWPFVFDTALTLVRRAVRRENIFAPHRSHLYQRLVIAGWSHPAVATLYMGWAVLVSVASGLWAVEGWSNWMLGAVPLISALIWAIVLMQEATVRRTRRTRDGATTLQR
ncbi:MAG: glycosyltransferase family 4 protein [Vicinamibacterales bacterium]